MSNVATILAEMVHDEALNLADLASTYPVAVAQRTGWLLEFVADADGRAVEVESLARVAGGRSTPTPLEAYGPRRGPLDERWNIVVNGPIEPDL